MNITLTNTLTKKKEPFIPLLPPNVSLYVCGITPYDYAHIGHGRVYITFDLLVRILQFLNYNVTYVRNVTDIDDKLINKALEQAGDAAAYKKIADHFTDLFDKDLQQLNCLRPDHEPRVTACISEIITFIEGLIEKGHAYVVGDDVYFDISTFASYGKLSGRKIEDLKAGARVEINEQKKNPEDFALWKGNKENVFWPSPWGSGRPGWAIECSVMAKKHLGASIDIHGGGMDLIFPHHENEIAQSEGLHEKQFANFWMHNAFVNIDKEKMSKSLGNIIALHTLLEQKDPMILRFFYLQHHYRTPIDFAFEELNATQTAYKKLISHLSEVTISTNTTVSDFAQLLASDQQAQAMLNALCDDLNTPKFLGVVFEHLSTLKENKPLAAFAKTLLQHVLGLSLQPLKEETILITPEIEALIKEREEARKEKNWQRSDQIRDQLQRLGYQIQDKKI